MLLQADACFENIHGHMNKRESPVQMKPLLRACFAVFVWLAVAPALPAQQELRQTAAVLDSLEKRVRQSREQVAWLSARADSLAAVVEQQKKSGRGVLQDRALEAALHRADGLAAELQAAEARLDSARRAIRSEAVRLLQMLVRRVSALEKELEQAEKRSNRAEAARIRDLLADAESLRRRAEKWHVAPERGVVLVPVHIGPEDSPELLEEKADLLMDQADGLRRRAGILRRQLEVAAAEQHLQERLQAFVEDVRLFDPLSESVGERAGGAGESSPLASDARRSFDRETANSELLLSDELVVSSGLSGLSGAEREQALQTLRRQVQRMTALADSLAARAREVRLQARPQRPEEQ